MNNNEEVELSKDNTIAFKELKRRINDTAENRDVDDLKILRFLRAQKQVEIRSNTIFSSVLEEGPGKRRKARNFNVDKAESMLRRHLIWRKNEKVDTILQDYKAPEVLEKYFPFYIAGFCSDGQPLLVLQCGELDIKGIFKSVKAATIIRYVMHILEYAECQLRKRSEMQGKLLDKWNVVFNFENTTLFQVTNKAALQGLLQLFECYEANYPDRLEKAYIINVTAYFTIVINVLKTVLAPATMRKVIPLRKEEWRGTLKKLLDPDMLSIFNENRKDITALPSCLSAFNNGGKVPKRYFQNTNNRLIGKPGYITYKLKRSDTLDIPMKVKKSGSFLDWKFEIENYDIQFGLFYKKTEDEGEQRTTLIEYQRVDTDLEYETGSYFCQEPGIYILTFDNSYSWFRQKQVCCFVSVTEPEEKEETS